MDSPPSWIHLLRMIENGSRILLDHVGPLWCCSLRLELVHGTNPRDQLPDLILRDTPAPGGHAVRAAFDDRVKKVCRIIPVSPDILDQWRSDRTATVGMAPGAVVPGEEPLAFGDCERIAFVWIGRMRLCLCAARLQLTFTRRISVHDEPRGIGPEITPLTVAAG